MPHRRAEALSSRSGGVHHRFKWGPDRVRCASETVSGGDMEDNLEMNGLKPAERTRAAEQTGHDVMRSQAKAIAVGMRRG